VVWAGAPGQDGRCQRYGGRSGLQRRELMRRAEVARKDRHSLWQRAINENTNCLLRQYTPKGANLTVFSREELEAFAFRVDTQPLKAVRLEGAGEGFYGSN